jgi:acyl dehydratase
MPTVFPSPSELISAIGTNLGTTDWLPISQERINLFAYATGDHQWIHVDAARAKEGPFGATIAHGYLTMSLASCFLPQLLKVENTSMGINYGVNKVRFPAPVRVGSRVRATGEVIEAQEIKGGVQVVVKITIELEGSDKPACVIESVSRFLSLLNHEAIFVWLLGSNWCVRHMFPNSRIQST